jgi:hypothetical protein
MSSITSARATPMAMPTATLLDVKPTKTPRARPERIGERIGRNRYGANLMWTTVRR